MKIDNEFTVSVPIDRAWEVLTDLDGVARCLPGAEMTGVDGDIYAGKIKIKVGPVVSQYAGTARFVEKDDVTHRAVIDAKGKDSRGAGNASAMIDASLRADGAHTVVTVSTDLNISGKIAQFGSGMIKEVSGKLLGQFVQNLEARLLAPASGHENDSLENDSLENDSRVGVSELGAPDVSVNGGSATGSPTAAAAAAAGGPAAPTVPAAPAGPAAGAAAAGRPALPGRPMVSDAGAEPLDLMSLAGGTVYKRLIPVVGVLVVALISYFVGRARGRGH